TLERPRDVMHLCFTAPALGGAISAVIGIAALHLSGQVAGSDVPQAWRGWWVGDIAGAQLMAPFLLAWLQPRELIKRPLLEQLLQIGLVAISVLGLLLFAGGPPEPFAYSRLLLLLALIWIAFSWDLRLVTLVLVGIALLSGYFAAVDGGPFAGLGTQEIQVRLQLIIAAVSTMTLSLAATNRQRRTAEQDRSRMAARLDEVLDSLDDVIWTLDPAAGRYTYMSGAMARLFNRPVQDFCDDPELWLKQVHEADLEATLLAFRQVFQAEVDHEFRIIDGAGNLRWMRARARPVIGTDGQVLRIDGITQDVTSLHRATEHLAASEERLRRALGASEVGVWDWDVGAGALHFVLAVPSGNQYGLADRSVSLAEWEASLHPDDRNRAMQALADCREGRNPRFRCEYRMRTRQDHWRWYRGEGQVVESGSDGQARRLAGTFRDIHERKQVEEELEKLSMAVEQNPSVVFITDAAGRFEYCNQAFSEVTGYSLEDILGQTPQLLKSGLHESGIYSELWRTINAGQTWRGRLLNRRRDGSIYVCLQAIAPIRDANGRVTHFVSISQDLTELQETPDLWALHRASRG
ncbi:MAG TPA: PAS domain-containing protein, partial [Azospira sp.]|nr:PAS domain-containing protein [Azospira sp.]